jgi:uncharacterized protein with PQ loop repeat
MPNINTLSIFETATTIMGCLMSIGIIPHVRRMNTYKTSEGQSLLGAVIFEVCYVWWFTYGIIFAVKPVIISNVVAIIAGAVLIYTIIKWRAD